MSELTHLDARGQARMVDVGHKADSEREAVARGEVRMNAETYTLIRSGGAAKGDVLAAARIAGIMAAKRTGDLIPLCHPLPIASAKIDFRFNGARHAVEIQATVRTVSKTGVEMEALTAVSVAALTLYDMAKASDKSMVIDNIRLVRKTGGKSGAFNRPGEAAWEAD